MPGYAVKQAPQSSSRMVRSVGHPYVHLELDAITATKGGSLSSPVGGSSRVKLQYGVK